MKAAILARVSTKDQEEGHSLEAQIANLRLYADRKGLEIIRDYTIVESSTKGHRPEFMQMIDFIRGQKEKIAVIVDTVDRLQRSFKETSVLKELFEKDLLELHFVKEGNVLSKDSNAFQKAMWNMGVMMAQSYTVSNLIAFIVQLRILAGHVVQVHFRVLLSPPCPNTRKEGGFG